MLIQEPIPHNLLWVYEKILKIIFFNQIAFFLNAHTAWLNGELLSMPHIMAIVRWSSNSGVLLCAIYDFSFCSEGNYVWGVLTANNFFLLLKNSFPHSCCVVLYRDHLFTGDILCWRVRESFRWKKNERIIFYSFRIVISAWNVIYEAKCGKKNYVGNYVVMLCACNIALLLTFWWLFDRRREKFSKWNNFMFIKNEMKIYGTVP